MENVSQQTREINAKESVLVDRFPQVEKAQIGQKLGEGMGHVVYAYGLDKVLKVPKRSVSPAQKIEEYQAIQKYFPNLLVQTEIMTDLTQQHYLLVQRRLQEFSNLTPKNIPEIQDQLNEALRVNRMLVKEQGISLDFLGKEGMTNSVKAYFSKNTQPEISNVVIERVHDRAQLVLPDFSLLRFGGTSLQTQEDMKSHLISKVTFRLNRRIILDKFGFDIS